MEEIHPLLKGLGGGKRFFCAHRVENRPSVTACSLSMTRTVGSSADKGCSCVFLPAPATPTWPPAMQWQARLPYQNRN